MSAAWAIVRGDWIPSGFGKKVHATGSSEEIYPIIKKRLCSIAKLLDVEILLKSNVRSNMSGSSSVSGVVEGALAVAIHNAS